MATRGIQNWTPSAVPFPSGATPSRRPLRQETRAEVTEITDGTPGLAPDLRLAERDPDEGRLYRVVAVAEGQVAAPPIKLAPIVIRCRRRL